MQRSGAERAPAVVLRHRLTVGGHGGGLDVRAGAADDAGLHDQVRLRVGHVLEKVGHVIGGVVHDGNTVLRHADRLFAERLLEELDRQFGQILLGQATDLVPEESQNSSAAVRMFFGSVELRVAQVCQVVRG